MLVTLLVGLVIVALLWWALTNLPLPPILQRIGTVLLVVLSVLWLLGLLTGRHVIPGL